MSEPKEAMKTQREFVILGKIREALSLGIDVDKLILDIKKESDKPEVR